MKFTRDELRRAMLLYAVTDRSWLNGRTLEEDVEAALKNGVTFLQLREKELPGREGLAQAVRLKELARAYRVPFVVNDRVELALESGADGVHVGQKDIRGRDIRAMLGPDRILGVTANTVELALAAQAAGADYVGAGAVFGTSTKKDANPLTMDRLRAICRAVDIPVVAIGGISAQNIHLLSGSGAAGAAVVSALLAAPDIGAAARDLLARAREMEAGHG